MKVSHRSVAIITYKKKALCNRTLNLKVFYKDLKKNKSMYGIIVNFVIESRPNLKIAKGSQSLYFVRFNSKDFKFL